jgi:dihydrodipicolinate synthase/N-acetylneuraminate lyase
MISQHGGYKKMEMAPAVVTRQLCRSASVDAMTTSSPLRTPPAALPALVTPFDAAGDLDATAHDHNIGLLAERGVTGFLIAGSTGEGPYLLAGERGYLLSIARDKAPHAFLLCGVAAQSVAQARQQIRGLEEADAALVVTPNMLAPTPDHQIRYYRAVADEATLPVWLYTVPAVTGYNLPVDAVIALSTHPNIAGIKDSSGMPERIAEMRQNCPDDFMIYAGASRALAASRRVGADGAITASGNYAFNLVDSLVEHSPEDEAVDTIQAELTELTAVVEAHRIPGTKIAATRAGLIAGMPRAPLAAVSDGVAAEITDAVGSFLDRHADA